MIRSRGHRRAIMLLTLSLALSAAGAGAARATESPAEDPIRIIPAETLFCVRINNLNTTLSQMDQFLTGIFPMVVSMQVRGRLGQLLGNPEAKGIDMSGDFAIFGPLPGGETPDPGRIGVLVPVSDYQQFVQGNPNVGPPNAQGVSTIGPEDGMRFVAANVGSYALITTMAHQQALTEVKTWLSGPGMTPLARRLSPDELKRAGDSPVWAYVNIQTAAKMFGPMIQQKLQETRKKLQEMQAQAKDQPMMGQTDTFMDMQMAMLNSLMQEIQFVSLSLEPSATVLHTSFLATAVPETDMAKIFSANNSQQLPSNLMGYLKSGAIMNGVASLSPAFNRAVTLQQIDLLAAALGKTVSKEEIARIRKLALESTQVFRGDVAWSFSANPQGKPPFEGRYVATLADRQRLNTLQDQSIAMMNEGVTAKLIEQAGLKIQASVTRNAETYKDVAVDAIRIAIQPVDANSPPAQMVTNMLGGEINFRLAVVNDLFLYALSADPATAIHTLIDQAKSGGSPQVPSEVQAAMQLIPDAKQADFFGTYNYLRVLQMVMAMMPMPVPMPRMEMPTQSSIAFAGDIGDSKLLIRAAIPKQHVQEIMTFYIKMQQQQMQQRETQNRP